MSDSVPEGHPLRQLFHSAVDRAFHEFRDLYAPGVAEHIGDNVLADFVHVDRLYRLRNLQGKRLQEVAEMVQVAHEDEGPERRLEVDRYIGDFVLFMGGFFPQALRRRRWFAPAPLVSRVGKVLVTFERPMDYYLAEARNAYGRAARTARIFDPESQSTYRRLGEHVEGYLELVATVRRLLQDDPHVRQVEGLIG